MVDLATWERLDDDERREFRALLPVWQKTLENQGVWDGTALLTGWEISGCDGAWNLTRTGEPQPLLTATRRAVLQALLRDAIQNLNR